MVWASIKTIARRPIYGSREVGGYVRNYSTVMGYPLAHGSKAFIRGTAPEFMRRFSDVVFFASRDKNASSQVLKWFRHGFLDRERTLVVGKILHPAISLEHIREFEGAELNYLFYHFIRDLDFTSARSVLYPYNTQWNPSVVRQRGPQHIFLGHGDSDKAGSTNPMLRLYDRILVSGQLAVERLLSAGIVNAEDVLSGRVVRIGMPYLPSVRQDLATSGQHILYAPTWEGSDGEQYSSLRAGYGRELLSFLLTNTRSNIIFRPHPSTGIRRPEYRAYLQEIVREFQHSPRFQLHVESTAHNAVTFVTGARTRHCTLEASLQDAKWVLADISSVASSAVHYEVPFVLLHDGDSFAAFDGISRFAAAHLRIGEPPGNKLSLLCSEARHADAVAAVRAAREFCSGVEPYLVDLPYEAWMARILAETKQDTTERLSRSEHKGAIHGVRS